MDFRGANMIESEMRDRLVAKNADIDRLRTENAALTARVAELEERVALKGKGGKKGC